MSDVVNDLNQVANDIGTTHPCCGDVCIAAAVYVAELEQQLAELNSPVQLSEWQKMERQLAELREALHEIYGKACQAMSEDDDLYLYGFAKDARDIALEAATALLEGDSDNG